MARSNLATSVILELKAQRFNIGDPEILGL